jgi:hypothetical protein
MYRCRLRTVLFHLHGRNFSISTLQIETTLCSETLIDIHLQNCMWSHLKRPKTTVFGLVFLRGEWVILIWKSINSELSCNFRFCASVKWFLERLKKLTKYSVSVTGNTRSDITQCEVLHLCYEAQSYNCVTVPTEVKQLFDTGTLACLCMLISAPKKKQIYNPTTFNITTAFISGPRVV